MNSAKEARLKNVFGDAVALLPSPNHETAETPYSYAHAARRYLLTEPDLSFEESRQHMDGWFVSVVASWIDDIGLDGALKAMKKETYNQLGKQKPLGKNNWLEKISRGMFTHLPEQSHRDEIMYLIVCLSDEKCNFELMPETLERRGRFSVEVEQTPAHDEANFVA